MADIALGKTASEGFGDKSKNARAGNENLKHRTLTGEDSGEMNRMRRERMLRVVKLLGRLCVGITIHMPVVATMTVNAFVKNETVWSSLVCSHATCT